MVEIIDVEDTRQNAENELFIKNAKETLIECVNDLKVAGFTYEQIVSFICNEMIKRR